MSNKFYIKKKPTSMVREVGAVRPDLALSIEPTALFTADATRTFKQSPGELMTSASSLNYRRPINNSIDLGERARPIRIGSSRSGLHHRPSSAIGSGQALSAGAMFRTGPSITGDETGMRQGSAGSAAGMESTGNSGSSSRRGSLLANDHVILGDSPSHPDVPLAYRSPEERAANPDRLSLDRRGLTVCPILDGEENLRLLNYQHNIISRIQHLSALKKLIFLDLYDNRIDIITGLAALKSLRVLMLGKNRITRIEGLDNLTKLDVLDLHGNQISDMENLGHLSELRVLNLAGNLVSEVRGLIGLDALTELNLRRNRIRSVDEVEALPSLQRLFLSANEISSWQHIACLGESGSLTELTLDGNPLSRDPCYKQTILRSMPQLRQLDMKRIAEEERRLAAAMAKKEDEKRRDTTVSKAAIMKEKRRLAINNAKRQWETMQAHLMQRSGGRVLKIPDLYATHVGSFPVSPALQSRNGGWRGEEDGVAESDRGFEASIRDHGGRNIVGTLSPSSPALPDIPAIEAASIGQKTAGIVTSPGLSDGWNQPINASQDDTSSSLAQPEPDIGSRIISASETAPSSGQPGSHLAEISGDQLHLYGPGSLETLDRQWGLQAAGAVTGVVFRFIEFDDITKYLHKMRARFPGVNALVFHAVNLHSYSQINALGSLRKLDSLTIRPEGNPITHFQLWRYFVIYRLSHLNLKKINDEEIQNVDVVNAERLFSSLGHMTSSQTTLAPLLVLMGEARRKQTPADKALYLVDHVGRCGMAYRYPDQTVGKKQELSTKLSTARMLVNKLASESQVAERNRAALAGIWPSLFRSLIGRAVDDIAADRQAFMRRALLELTFS